MTNLHTTVDLLTPAGTRAAPRAWLARGWETLNCWIARSRSRSVLAGMDEHMLRDIGLSRADVVIEVRKHFWER